jgi:hypothetical protein
VHEQPRLKVLKRVIRQMCATTRGPYVWRETAQKRQAAALLARGMSAREVSRRTGANRRSIARWQKRDEFIELINHAELRLWLARGGFRALQEITAACVASEIEAARALTEVDDERSVAVSVESLRAVRVWWERERAAAERPSDKRIR